MKKITFLFLFFTVPFLVLHGQNHANHSINAANVPYYTANLAPRANYQTIIDTYGYQGREFVAVLDKVVRGEELTAEDKKRFKITNPLSGNFLTATSFDPSRAENRRLQIDGRGMALLDPTNREHTMVYDSLLNLKVPAGCGNYITYETVISITNTGSQGVNTGNQPEILVLPEDEGGVSNNNLSLNLDDVDGYNEENESLTLSETQQSVYSDPLCSRLAEQYSVEFYNYTISRKLNRSTRSIVNKQDRRDAKYCLTGRRWFGRNWWWITGLGAGIIGGTVGILSGGNDSGSGGGNNGNSFPPNQNN